MSRINNSNDLKRKILKEKILVLTLQVTLIMSFLITWEILSRKGIISSFLFSSPTKVLKTLKDLYLDGLLWTHIWATLYEIIISFIIGIIFGFIIAIILYEIPLLERVCAPFLTMINSLPKVALGPIIIIWFGANIKSVIVMALLINLIVSILNIYNGFQGVDSYRLKLLETLGSSKKDTLKYLIIPESKRTILSSLKINISMTLIGVIMGEFLVSKKGLGYLIIYGTQVFKLDLVMTGIFLLIIISFILYKIVTYFEKKWSR